MLLCIAVSYSGLESAECAPLPVPQLDGYVNDRAGLLTPDESADLDAVLRATEDRTTNQIAVLTVPSLQGEALEDFSIRVARAWQLGQKGRDNGVLLVVAHGDRKIRIEVGYGLEGALTDAESKRIIANVVAPQFRMGRFGEGIRQGVLAIIEAVDGEFAPAPEADNRAWGWQEFAFLWTLVLIPILIISAAALREGGGRPRGKRLYYGGHRRSGGKRQTDHFHGSNFSGGGFSSEGGFSGGGGSFGGGGASGSW